MTSTHPSRSQTLGQDESLKPTPPMLALLLPTLAQDAVPGPSSKSDFARLSASACSQNSSLVHYFFPKRLHGNVHDSWQAQTSQCRTSTNCYCRHVKGSRDKEINPNPEYCEIFTSNDVMKRRILKVNCTQRMLHCKQSCTTGSGRPCLYSNMAPGTNLAVVALARAAGVNHIIEEGRQGGLSAFIYW